MVDDLLSEIDDFLRRNGMASSRFGRLAVNDWSFVRSLRRGRRVWPETAARVRRYMTGLPEERAGTAPRSTGPDKLTPVRRPEDVAPDTSSTPAPIPARSADRWAGRTVTCVLCDRRLTETTVRACQAPDCPHSDRDAA